MRISFLELAEFELNDAFEYYQTVLDNLGYEFVKEIKLSLDRIKRFPGSYQEIGKHSRRCLVHKFPYGIIYQIREKEILVIAISNLHREPEYWAPRVPKT